MKKKYNIVFYGKINVGWDIEVVKKNLSGLAKKDGQNIDSLFAGKPVVLKKILTVKLLINLRPFLKKQVHYVKYKRSLTRRI